MGASLSTWSDVVSGVPQGSVLGPILFLCFINDLPEVVSGFVKVFADDTKIYSEVPNTSSCEKLQTDLDNLNVWSRDWKLAFNASKCKVIHIGSANENYRYTMTDNDGNHSYIETVSNEKDLGVTFDNQLSFEDHINIITMKARRTLGIIHRSFEFLDRSMFLTLYKSLVRPVLEYGSSVWSPYLKRDIKKLEDIQRRATKMVPCVASLPYEERMRELGLVSLEYRRDRADLIQIYKSVHNLDQLKWDKLFTFVPGDSRGHSLRFRTKKCAKNIRLHSFSVRSIHFWNNLKEDTVTAKTINQFKSSLNSEKWNSKKFRPTCY